VQGVGHQMLTKKKPADSQRAVDYPEGQTLAAPATESQAA
jgi:hypothetical protein